MNYYTSTCKCGCDGQIEVKRHHKWRGIPLYISGHNTKNKKRNLKHGGKGTRLYNIHHGIKLRILNKNNKDYKNYGGRGITICNEWLEFIPFRDWSLSNGYSENLVIDRKENDLGYSPENCQWITIKENSRKTRKVKLILEIANEIRELYKTGKYTQQELAEKYDVSQSLIWFTINNKRWV